MINCGSCKKIVAVILPQSFFYHIPKTGGSWVTEVLKEVFTDAHLHSPPVTEHKMGLSGGHITPKDINPNMVESRLTFCFVTNPVEWYKSYWVYKKGNLDIKNNGIDKLMDPNFCKFVENCLTEFPKGLVTTTYKQYTPIVDFVGTQEK